MKKCEICNGVIIENAENLQEIEGYNRAEYCNECYLHDIMPSENQADEYYDDIDCEDYTEEELDCQV